ncbi:MAG: hypothetical protein M3209_14650 [Acidobacteriota bacterium]|nr:hypothetical protein [Acidobacteriota bacterium]
MLTNPRLFNRESLFYKARTVFDFIVLIENGKTFNDNNFFAAGVNLSTEYLQPAVAKSFFIMSNQKKKPKKDAARPIFDSLRKPTAPPSRTIGKRKPEEKAHPAERKIKHKKTQIIEE